jgi:hypothetical protein
MASNSMKNDTTQGRLSLDGVGGTERGHRGTEAMAQRSRTGVGARGFRPATSGAGFGQLLSARCGFYPCRTASGEHRPGQPIGRQR